MSKVSFQLPFHGSWFVFWGGDTKAQNHHHGNTVEKYALDMVIVDKHGQTHKGNGAKNTDYYAFGQDILAPAHGEVIEAVDGHCDNIPQKTTNDYAYGGNYVIVKHADNLYSMLQHLRFSSVQVKVGESVKVGQKVGECGNSGNSSEPHLHFHLMDDAILSIYDAEYNKIPKAKGIKAYFETNTKKCYAPIKGDTVASPQQSKSSQ